MNTLTADVPNIAEVQFELPSFTSGTMSTLQNKCDALYKGIAAVTEAANVHKIVEANNKTWTVGLAGGAASLIMTALGVCMYAALVFGVIYAAPAYIISAAVTAIFLALAGALDLFTDGILAAPVEVSQINDDEESVSDSDDRSALKEALLMLTPVGWYKPMGLALNRVSERSAAIKKSQGELTDAQKEFVTAEVLKLVKKAIESTLELDKDATEIAELTVLQKRLLTVLRDCEKIS